MSNRERAYVLRIRQMANGNRPKWIYSLKSAETQAVQRFDTLDALLAFIQQEQQNDRIKTFRQNIEE